MSANPRFTTDLRVFVQRSFSVILACKSEAGTIYRILESRVASRKQAFRLALVWSLSWDEKLTGLPQGKKSIIIQTNEGQRIAKIRCTKERTPKYEQN